MDFDAVQSRLGLDDDEMDVLFGFLSFNEEPLDRVAHLCRVEEETLARVLPDLMARGIVKTRHEHGKELYSLAPLDTWLVPDGNDEYTEEMHRIKRLFALRDKPAIVVISSREIRDRSRLVPELIQHFTDQFPNVDLRIGTRCNLNCVYCLLGHEARFTRPTQEIVSELAFAREQNLEKVAFTGGEPTVHKDIFKLIAIARHMGFRYVMLITNGVMLAYEGLLERFVNEGVNLVGISFDTADRATAESMWQRPVFDYVVNALTKAVSHPKIVTRTIAVITKKNADQLVDLARFFSEVAKASSNVFVPNLDFVMPEENAWKHRYELVPRLSDVVDQVREALSVAHAAGIPMTFRGIPFCLLQGFERYSMDLYMSIFRLVRTPKGVVFDRDAMDVLRKKAKSCRGCVWFRECTGVSRSYASLYGLDELKPVSKV